MINYPMLLLLPVREQISVYLYISYGIFKYAAICSIYMKMIVNMASEAIISSH